MDGRSIKQVSIILNTLLLLFSLKQYFFTQQSMILKDKKYKGPFSMDYRERGSHAWGVYPAQYTSGMGTTRVKQKEETNTRIMQESKKSGRK